MIRLYDVATSRELGTITDAQLQFLVDQLEEESSTDQDYFVDLPTLEMLEQAGADAPLLELLRGALGTSDGVDVRWERG